MQAKAKTLDTKPKLTLLEHLVQFEIPHEVREQLGEKFPSSAPLTPW